MRIAASALGLVIGLLSFALASQATAREWTSSNGKFKIEAEFVALKDGKVVLEKPDGSYLSVELSKLSQADIDFVEEKTGKKKMEDSPFVETKPANSSGGTSSESDSSSTNPTSSVTKPRTIKLKGSKEGDPAGVVRDFGDQGWGLKSLAFSGDGGVLVGGKMDQMVAVYDVNEASRKNITDRLDDAGIIEAVAVSLDGKRVLAGGYKGLVKTWTMTPEGALEEGALFAGHEQGITSIAISPDGRFALTGSKDKTARYWQIDTGKEFEFFGGFKRDVLATWISEDGSKALASDGIMLGRIDLVAKKGVMTKIVENGSPQFVAFSPNGKYVALNDGYNIRLWDLTKNSELPSLKSNDIQWTGAFTPDSNRIVSGATGIVNVWDVKSQKRVGALTVKGGTYIQTLAVSPDNQHIAAHSGNAGGNLIVFRLPPP